ncbi:MAG TPA: hypothetical protein VH277_04300, partial [Gemmatimonadaceae bacterium]|nr:hypothetical protein [Gemmatimonadaceae bacterium]
GITGRDEERALGRQWAGGRVVAPGSGNQHANCGNDVRLQRHAIPQRQHAPFGFQTVSIDVETNRMLRRLLDIPDSVKGATVLQEKLTAEGAEGRREGLDVVWSRR